MPAVTPRAIEGSSSSNQLNISDANPTKKSAAGGAEGSNIGRYLVVGVSVASLFVAVLFLLVAYLESSHEGPHRKVPLPWLRSWVKSPVVGPTTRRNQIQNSESSSVVRAHLEHQPQKTGRMHHIDTSLAASNDTTAKNSTAKETVLPHKQKKADDMATATADLAAQQTGAGNTQQKEEKQKKGKRHAEDKYKHTRAWKERRSKTGTKPIQVKEGTQPNGKKDEKIM